MKKIDLIGKKFGRLTVLENLPSESRGINSIRMKRFVLCLCECGEQAKKDVDSLLNGKTNSCGCLSKESIASVNYKHGEANKTKENRSWQHMISRCYSKNDKKYKIYGGRGIKVCDRWLNSYTDFLLDMGRCPDKSFSIDRINVDGNYEPTNCRWASAKTQGNNTRSNVIIEEDGKRLNIKQWAEELGVNYKSLHTAIRYRNKTIKDYLDGRVLNSVPQNI